MKTKLTAIAFALLMPGLAFAQELEGLDKLLKAIGDLVDTATPIVVGIALLAFFWGLAKFIFAAGDPDRQKEGKSIMIWGIIALFVIVAVWGLVNFVAEALDIETNKTITVPKVPGL